MSNQEGFISQYDLATYLGVPSHEVRKAFAAVVRNAPSAWVSASEAVSIMSYLSSNPATLLQMGLITSRRKTGSFIDVLVRRGYRYRRNLMLMHWTYTEMPLEHSAHIEHAIKAIGNVLPIKRRNYPVTLIEQDNFTAIAIEPYGLSGEEESILKELYDKRVPGDTPDKRPTFVSPLAFCDTCGAPLLHLDNGCIFCKAEKYLK